MYRDKIDSQMAVKDLEAMYKEKEDLSANGAFVRRTSFDNPRPLFERMRAMAFPYLSLYYTQSVEPI